VSIHPTAILNPNAEIDPTVEVGPYCVIDGDVRIGPNCRLFHNVYVTGWTEIAEGCELHPGCVVGHVPGDIKYKGARTYCRVGRGSILREYVTIHRGTEPESATVIGERCFFLAGSHVGHNGTVGDEATVINNALLGGHVLVGRRATVGGQVGVHQFVRIGELAMIAGCAKLVMDIPPFALTDVQGRVAGLNRIGLRRAGVPREEVLEVRELYRVLYGSRPPFSRAVEKVLAAARSPAGRVLAEFLAAPSRRGIAGRSRSRHGSSLPLDES
jgi:UDP-N-acetylglucosamine acyltransferase